MPYRGVLVQGDVVPITSRRCCKVGVRDNEVQRDRLEVKS